MRRFPHVASLFVKWQNNRLSRSNTSRPHNARVIVQLLNNSSHRARNANAVATHNKRLFSALFVHECCMHALGIFHAKLKHLRHFNAARMFQRATATRTRVARFHFANITPRINRKIDPMTCANAVISITICSHNPRGNALQRAVGNYANTSRQANRTDGAFWQAKCLKLLIVHQREARRNTLSFNVVHLVIAWNKKCNGRAVFIGSDQSFYTFARRCVQKLC